MRYNNPRVDQRFGNNNRRNGAQNRMDFAAVVANRSSGQAASGLARDKGLGQDNGPAPGNGHRVDGPAQVNGLRVGGQVRAGLRVDEAAATLLGIFSPAE